jgi:UDP-glucose 4-epimerase
MGSDLEPAYGPERKVNAVSRRLADTSRAAADLGFTAEVSLDEGLRRLVSWWQSEQSAAAKASL